MRSPRLATQAGAQKSMTGHNSYEEPEERHTPGPTEEDVAEREAVEAVEALSFQQLELAVSLYIKRAQVHALEDAISRMDAEILQQAARDAEKARISAEAAKRRQRRNRKERSDIGQSRGTYTRRAS